MPKHYPVLHVLYGMASRTLHNMFHATKQMTRKELQKHLFYTKPLPHSIELVHTCPLRDNPQGMMIKNMYLGPNVTLKYKGPIFYANNLNVNRLEHIIPRDSIQSSHTILDSHINQDVIHNAHSMIILDYGQTPKHSEKLTHTS